MLQLARLYDRANNLHGFGSAGIDDAVAGQRGSIFRCTGFQAARIKELRFAPGHWQVAELARQLCGRVGKLRSILLGGECFKIEEQARFEAGLWRQCTLPKKGGAQHMGFLSGRGRKGAGAEAGLGGKRVHAGIANMTGRFDVDRR